MHRKFIEYGKAFVRRNSPKAIALVTIVAISICGALAEGTPANDYTTSLTQFKTDFAAMLSTNGPLLMGALVVALGFGVVWKLIKRAAKSV